ncbi:M43 family zinc metalloprotease [Puia sp.]|uniref:M43 family zinc metalloprotease n=1 Tax=Puia sp. TaxID=2045100 RepID=UPI002F3E2DC6
MILLAIVLSSRAIAQPLTCGQKQATDALISRNPDILAKSARIESQWRAHLKKRTPATPIPLGTVITTLPVVVHVIHDNGPENISDVQVLTAIQHLNEAYSRSGYYDPADGADPHIQFCLAGHDPSNQPTNGITHDVSPYTNMGDMTIDDLNVKNTNRWNPLCYINIWVVRSIPGNVAGYAYLPPAHGSDEDGIVVEADLFGTSYANDVVLIHEMGHYLGLYHTFEGGCTNNDCSVDGDRICDTPPDQSTAYVNCGQAMNSCSTDMLSGFSSDQDDLTRDYMDYGNISCMTLFTPDQADRMNWSIQNVRMSLLACKSCMPPCPSPVAANFSIPPGTITPGVPIVFTNTSVNGSSYTWTVNGVQQATGSDLNFTFPTAGHYLIRLVAASGNTTCVDGEKDLALDILCPAVAAFAPADTSILINGMAHFTYTGANAASWQWWLDGTMVGTGANYDATFPAAGSHAIRLVATDGHCSSETTGRLQVIDPADSCSIHTFQKTMAGTRGQVLWAAAIDGQDNYLVSGLTSNYGPAQTNGLVMKLSPAGVPLWAEVIGDLRVSRIYSGKVVADGGSIHAGVVTEASGKSSANLIRLDGQGRLQWAKKYSDPLFSLSTTTRAFPLSSGGYILCAAISGSTRPLRVVRTDADGNVLWSKTLLDAMQIYDVWMLEDNGQLIFAVSNFSFATISSRGLLFAMDEISGNFIWGKYYDWPGLPVSTGKVYAYQGNYLLSSQYKSDQFGALLVDKQGNLSSAFAVQDPSTNVTSLESDIAIANDKSLVLTFSGSTGLSPQDAALVNITVDGKLIAAKKYLLPGVQNLYSLQATRDKGYLAAGGHSGIIGDNGLYFLKTDSALRLFPGATGGASCPVVDFTPAITPAPLVTTPFTSPSSDAGITAIDYQPQVISFVPPIVDYCEDPMACSLLAITGKDTACNSRDSLLLTATRNRDCSGKVIWALDGEGGTIDQPTDSTVSLHFNKPGRMLLHARMAAGCRILTDSVWLEVPEANDTVDLGPDLALCNQSTVKLNAGAGFRSYLWQNGSVDSTFTAYLPGTYWVTATDYCNVNHTDSLILSTIASPPFDLGPGITLCQGDSVQLPAPTGFSAYNWAPGYRISDQTAASPFVSPETDTVYTCTATAGAGCTVVDTIRVQVSVCRDGLFFPGAFSPNKDGANDLFRPIIRGPMPIGYYLEIFNREGQIVFESLDATAGWDGRVRGIPSVTNSFVWQCRYRLPGEPVKVEKGVLVLVR